MHGAQGVGPRPHRQGIRCPICIRRSDGLQEARHIPGRRTHEIRGWGRLPVPEEGEEEQEPRSPAPPPCLPLRPVSAGDCRYA